MGKYKYLLKNVGVMTIASLTTKLLAFFLVPLYTNVLTTAEYGAYDLFNTTVGILLPILTLNIQEGVLRYALDKNYNRSAISTVGTRYLLLGAVIMIVGLVINSIFSFSELVNEYAIFFFILFFSQALTGCVSFYIRGIGRVVDLSISSIAASVVTIGLNILFLLVFKWGLMGYFLASTIGPLVQNTYLILRAGVLKEIHLTYPYKNETKDLVSYSVPLIANGIAWWVNNASDRYIVIFFCGLEANGIYSVGAKIPSILNVFQSIFNQAWTLSAVKDFEPDDRSGFFTTTYMALNCLLTIVCSAIIVLDKILAEILYAKDFFAAWEYVPWLTVAVLFGGMSSFVGGFFSAAKDSKAFAIGTIIGAVSNIMMNFIFTPIMGPLGAAIATTLSYAEVFFIRLIQSRKYIKLKINPIRDVFAYTILIGQALTLLFITENTALYTLLGVTFVMLLLLFVKDIVLIFQVAKGKLRYVG